jgi:hypothetical protein
MQIMQFEPVRSLWIGDALPAAHAACIASYLRVGHPFELFTYGQVEGVPRGVRVRDANEIVSRERVFRYGEAAGEGRGGLSGFSNLFRYALLVREGGYWVDCDMFCLRPFPTDPMVISTERMRNGRRTVTSCVLKCPAGDPLAHYCLARAVASDPKMLVHGETGPALVAEVVKKRSLEHALAAPEVFCSVDWFAAERLYQPGTVDRAACGVHLWGEIWRREEGDIPWPGPRGGMMHDLSRIGTHKAPGRGRWWRTLRGLARDSSPTPA